MRSQPIRGKKGNAATKEDMAKNNQQAIEFAKYVRKCFPVELYVPAEHEDFIQIAYDKGWINIEQILTVDGEILKRCDGVIFYLPDGMKISDSQGMSFEKCVAQANDIPWVEINCYTYDEVYEGIRFLRNKCKETV